MRTTPKTCSAPAARNGTARNGHTQLEPHPSAVRLATLLQLAEAAARELRPVLEQHHRDNGGRCCDHHCAACALRDTLRDALGIDFVKDMANVAEDARCYLRRRAPVICNGRPAALLPASDQLLTLLVEAQRTAEGLRADLERHACKGDVAGMCGRCHLLDALDDTIRAVNVAAHDVYVHLSPVPLVDMLPLPTRRTPRNSDMFRRR